MSQVVAVVALVLAFVAVVGWWRISTELRCLRRHLRFNDDGTVRLTEDSRVQESGGPPNCYYAWVCRWNWWPPGQTCTLEYVCD